MKTICITFYFQKCNFPDCNLEVVGKGNGCKAMTIQVMLTIVIIVTIMIVTIAIIVTIIVITIVKVKVIT